MEDQQARMMGMVPMSPQPATSSQNAAQLSGLIEEQNHLIKKQCELYREFREQQAELMTNTMDEMRKMKECIEELKTMVVAHTRRIDDMHRNLRDYMNTEWTETTEWIAWSDEPTKFDR